MQNIFAVYARFVLARPKTCLFIAFSLLLAFAFLGKDVRLNNNFAALFSINNDANNYRQFYRQQFDADDAVLVAILQPDIVDKSFFEALVATAKQLETNPHFIKVYSPLTSSIVWSDDEAIYVDPIYDNDWPLSIEEMLALMRTSPFTAGRLMATHSNTFAIIAQMPSDYDSYDKVKTPAAEFQHIVDAHFQQQSVKQHVQRVGISDSVDDLSGHCSLLLAGLDAIDPLDRLVVYPGAAVVGDGSAALYPGTNRPAGAMAGPRRDWLAVGYLYRLGRACASLAE